MVKVQGTGEDPWDMPGYKIGTFHLNINLLPISAQSLYQSMPRSHSLRLCAH